VPILHIRNIGILKKGGRDTKKGFEDRSKRRTAFSRKSTSVESTHFEGRENRRPHPDKNPHKMFFLNLLLSGKNLNLKGEEENERSKGELTRKSGGGKAS